MMNSLLARAATSTFEELAFLFAEGEPTDAQREAALDVAVAVAFRGAVLGELVLEVSSNLLPGLAASMLGVDAVASDDEQRDALGELANVICGNLMPTVAGARAVISLEAPRVVQAGPREAGLTATTLFGAGAGQVRVQLILYSGEIRGGGRRGERRRASDRRTSVA